MRIAPYGSWESPISPDLVTQASVAYSDSIEVDGTDIYWMESRPLEGGRSVVVRRSGDGTVTDAVPEGFNARTRVHEYGGGAYAVARGVLFASSFEDQRIYRFEDDSDPAPITPEPEIPAGARYADATLSREWGIWVRELHQAEGEPLNDLVLIPLDGSADPERIVSGHDFCASPRLSPDGSQLAFVAWDHPNMPWNGTTLYVAPIDEHGVMGTPEAVAGGDAESIFQPTWSPDGDLYFSSDRSGWWNPYRLMDDEVKPVCQIDGDVGSTAWTFRRSRMAFLGDGNLVMVATGAGGPRILVHEGAAGLREIESPGTAILPYVALDGRDLVLITGAADRAPQITVVDVDRRSSEFLTAPGGPAIDPTYLSVPEIVAFETPDGLAYGYHYPPRNPEFSAPAGEQPPLIVFSHGGPTGGTTTALSLGIQYWTSRGFAVVDVDYGGSAGYGRAYWERLAGTWGIVDVRDCALAAQHLVAGGKADGDRLAIRGGSAGGYTTLAVLAFRDDFAAGASHFGVADLKLLAEHTHKFESRYLDWLIGPLPEAEEVYRERSPIFHADQIACPIVLFQGLEDRVVPPKQAELMAEKLRENGVPVALIEFEGEGHGFRKAENQVKVLQAELSFYGQVFGFEPAGSLEPVIEV